MMRRTKPCQDPRGRNNKYTDAEVGINSVCNYTARSQGDWNLMNQGKRETKVSIRGRGL
jgi:hypothetical protein